MDLLYIIAITADVITIGSFVVNSIIYVYKFYQNHKKNNHKK